MVDPMTGKSVYNVPEPYNKDETDSCDYTPPAVSLSVSGKKIIATILPGSYDVSGYTLYVNGVEQSGVSLESNGLINGYTLDGTESSLKIVVTDTSGYQASSELTLTPTNTSGSSSGETSSSSSSRYSTSAPTKNN